MNRFNGYVVQKVNSLMERVLKKPGEDTRKWLQAYRNKKARKEMGMSKTLVLKNKRPDIKISHHDFVEMVNKKMESIARNTRRA